MSHLRQNMQSQFTFFCRSKLVLKAVVFPTLNKMNECMNECRIEHDHICCDTDLVINDLR